MTRLKRAKRRKPNTTCIQLEKSTRQTLRDLGKKGDTYDQIIQKLISSHGGFKRLLTYNK